MKRALVVVLCAACSSTPSTPVTPAAPGEPGAPTAPTPPKPPDPIAIEPPSAPIVGLDVAGIDRNVKPGDDFFMHANGAWFASAEIPADRSAWGTGAIISELTAKRTVELLDAAAKAAPGTEARKAGDYYATFMDEAGIEAKGITPLAPTLKAIAGIANARALARYLGTTLRADVDAFNSTDFFTDNVVGVWIAQDLDTPSKYSAFLMQGGLGLPDREYYLDASPRMVDIRTKYEAHLAAVMTLAKIADPAAKAKRVVELETRLAKAHMARAESHDVKNGKNRWPRAEFAKRAPGLDWDALFAGAALDKQPELVVWQPGALVGLAATVKEVPLATWKEYLVVRALEKASPVLPKAFVDESFAFYGGVLAGTPKLQDRWKRGVDATTGALGDAVGKLYVERYFSAAAKTRAQDMVKQLIAAMGRRIDALDWMSAETKQKARAKLAVLKVGVGYPDTWTDYSGLEIKAGDAFGNAKRAGQFDYQRKLARLGKPVDRGEWVMVPHLVNAVNLPAMNAMNFPAAILQPPYFDPDRPVVMDYGAIGAVIGHEISHSFDDQGAQFDDAGRLANWWTPDDLAKFQAVSQKLAAQYDTYKPFPDLAVNGKLTLSENIADLAGLAISFDAYRLASGGKEAPAIEGVSGDRQFFYSFAQMWRFKAREPALRQRVLTDGHAPAMYRVSTVRNIDAWYAAFGVTSGALFLAPPDRIRVW